VLYDTTFYMLFTSCYIRTNSKNKFCGNLFPVKIQFEQLKNLSLVLMAVSN